MADSAKQKAHPDFLGPADVTLVSADGTHFKIASHQLARASGWFRTLFTLPQGESKPATDQALVTLNVSEHTLTLEVLLSLCCLAPCLSKLANLSDVERCLAAAEKYEMPGATEVLLLLLHRPEMKEDAVHLYALADRYGEDAVAAVALKRVLSTPFDFATIAHVDLAQLKRIGSLRQARIAKFCSLFRQTSKTWDMRPFRHEMTGVCTRSTVHRSSNGNAWPTLVIALQTAFIKHPSVEALDSDKQVKAQIQVVEKIKCSIAQCQLQQYEWRDIRRRLSDEMEADDDDSDEDMGFGLY